MDRITLDQDRTLRKRLRSLDTLKDQRELTEKEATEHTELMNLLLGEETRYESKLLK